MDEAVNPRDIAAGVLDLDRQGLLTQLVRLPVVEPVDRDLGESAQRFCLGERIIKLPVPLEAVLVVRLGRIVVAQVKREPAQREFGGGPVTHVD